MRFTQLDLSSQRQVLRQLAKMAEKSIVQPNVREAAIAIVSACGSREDECELQAIYDAVKFGTDAVPGLERGFKYISDQRTTDYFVAPYRTLEQCARGSCGGDCDDHALLVAALAGSIGFKVGLRAWGPPRSDFEHVYAVAGLPKRNPTRAVGMDTTVKNFGLGDEPPEEIDGKKCSVLTAWLEDD